MKVSLKLSKSVDSSLSSLISFLYIQCDHREEFIETMKQLTYTEQEIMMNHIKDVSSLYTNIYNI